MLWPSLILGLAGSLHCVGMCGPLALALPGNPNRARFIAGRFLYNTGRVTTYVALGAIFGLFGETLALAGLQRGLSIAAGVILLGWLVLRLRPGLFSSAQLWIPRLIVPLKTALAKQLRARSQPALLAVGLLNGLLPCGLVYLALTAAAATGTAADGALSMLVFGAGTIPAMLAVSLFGQTLHAGLRAKFQRAVPVFVAALAVLFILRGMNLGIPYVSPELGVAHSCCH
jgi:uncharacterized protein